MLEAVDRGGLPKNNLGLGGAAPAGSQDLLCDKQIINSCWRVSTTAVHLNSVSDAFQRPFQAFSSKFPLSLGWEHSLLSQITRSETVSLPKSGSALPARKAGLLMHRWEKNPM